MLVRIVVIQVVVNLLVLLLVGLDEFFSDEVAVHIVIVLLFPRFVQVAIEVEEVAPGLGEIVVVPMHLLTHIYKVFSGHRVVKYGGASDLLEHLRGEEGGLLVQVVHLAG